MAPHSQPPSEPSQEDLAELAFLQQELAGVSGERTQLRKENAGLGEELDHAKQQLEIFRRLLFGPKSERHVPEPDPNQGNLCEEPETTEPSVTADKADGVEPKRHRRVLNLDDLPPDTPVEKHYFEPDEDTADRKYIGEVVTRFLELVPSRVKVVEWIRKKYVDPRNSDRGIIVADLPARVIDKGIAGPGLLAHMVNAKYVYHLPLHRQQRWFNEQGLDLPRSTMGDMVARVAWNLKPLHEALTKEAVEENEYLQVATLQVQDEGKKGQTHRGYVWTYLAAGLMVMEYTKTRCRAGPEAMLKNFQGRLQTDGVKGYEIFD